MKHRSMTELDDGNKIRASLTRIRRYYQPSMTGPHAADESRRRAGVPRSKPPVDLAMIDARKDAMYDLHFWCRFILDEINGGTITTKVDADLESMCTFIARWCDAVLEQHPDDAANLDKEMHAHAWTLECLARGWRTKKVPVGDCPEDVTVLTSEGLPKLDERGKEIRLPCTGRLHALIREQDTILPKEIRCDRTEDHRWSPWQFTALGRRLGNPISA